jgi:hypothetical protein
MKSPRISAFNIHEWIYEKLHLPEEDLNMIQIDGPKRHVYIKFKNTERIHQVLTDTEGQAEFKHDNGEISKVTIEPAGMGMRKIRIANLPPEVNDRTIKNMLMRYGEIKEITEETWTRNYRYKIYNCIRIVTINLKEHIPSHMTMANNRVLISYEGQPQTCYGCNTVGHQFQECPMRKQKETRQMEQTPTKWTDIVQKRKVNIPPEEDRPMVTKMQEDRNGDNEETTNHAPCNEGHHTEKTMDITNGIGNQKEREKDVVNTEFVMAQTTGGGKDEEEQSDMKGDTRGRNVETTATTSTYHGPENEQHEEMDVDKTTGNGQQQKEVKVRDESNIPQTSNNETMKHHSPTSPKRQKKQRLERDTDMTRDRTRSKERQRKTQKL